MRTSNFARSNYVPSILLLLDFGTRQRKLLPCSLTGNEQMDDDVLRQTALLSTCKSVVRAKIIKAKELLTALPGGYLLELPATLDGLPQPLRDQFFANGLPEAPLDLNRVWRSANAWPMRSSHRARQASGNWSLQQQGFQMNVIAQQAAMTTAQAMLAMSGQGAHQTLPGLQVGRLPPP